MMKKIVLVFMLAFGVGMADEFVDCVEGNNPTQKCAKYCDEDKTGGACYLLGNFDKACEKNKNYCDYDAKIDFAKGDKYLYSKDYKQTEIYYKQACQKSKNYCNGEAKIADAKKSESYKDYFQKGEEAFLAKNYKQAEIYFKQACEQAQYAETCENIGDAFLRIKDYTKADFFYQKACEKYINGFGGTWDAKNFDNGCAIIGYKYLDIENYEKAKFYYKKACEKNKSYCDYEAKIDFAKGDKYLYSKNYKQAEIYYKKACEKDKKYCDYERKIDIAKGESYEDYLKKGNEAFFAKQYKQAEIHYKKACEKQAPNDDYSAFKGFRQNCNAHTAMEYFDKVCSSYIRSDGYYTDCVLDDDSNLYRCDDYKNSLEVCMQLGDMYYKGNKEMGVEKNIPLAKWYWARASFNILDYLEGREKTKEQKGIKPDYTKARLLAEITCEDDEPIGQACEILGDIYAQGKGVKQDLNKAKAFYQKACENPVIEESGYSSRGVGCLGSYAEYNFSKSKTFFGCKKLGDIYYLGKNFEEARKWWAEAVEKGCSYGYGYNYDDMCREEKEWMVLSGYYQEAEGYYNGYVIKKEGEWDDKEGKHIEKDTYIKHEQDYKKAVLLASIGCIEFKDYKSCSILANANTQGKGVVGKSLVAAQMYLTAANQYEAKALYEETQRLRKMFCWNEDDEWILDYNPYDNNDIDKSQAVGEYRAQIKELLQRACDLDKSNQACTDLKNKSYKKMEVGLSNENKTSLIQYSAFALWLWGVRTRAAKASQKHKRV